MTFFKDYPNVQLPIESKVSHTPENPLQRGEIITLDDTSPGQWPPSHPNLIELICIKEIIQQDIFDFLDWDISAFIGLIEHDTRHRHSFVYGNKTVIFTFNDHIKRVEITDNIHPSDCIISEAELKTIEIFTLNRINNSNKKCIYLNNGFISIECNNRLSIITVFGKWGKGVLRKAFRVTEHFFEDMHRS